MRKRRPLYVYYLSADVQAGYEGLPNACVAVDAAAGIRAPVLADLLRGGVYAVKESARTEAGRVIFKSLPLTDYPLALTDREALEGRFDALPSPEGR